jgi:hypothetical protein
MEEWFNQTLPGKVLSRENQLIAQYGESKVQDLIKEMNNVNTPESRRKELFELFGLPYLPTVKGQQTTLGVYIKPNTNVDKGFDLFGTVGGFSGATRPECVLRNPTLHEEQDPNWYYTHQNWLSWPQRIQKHFVDKWRNEHTTDHTALYNLLLQDEYASEWYYINNYLSWFGDFPTLPNPNDALKNFNEIILNKFYDNKVPTAGAMIQWFNQMPSCLLDSSFVAKTSMAINTVSPDKWFSLTTKKIEKEIKENIPVVAGFGTLAVIGILGVATIVVASRK